MALAKVQAPTYLAAYLTSIDILEDVTRLAGVLSLLAAYRIGNRRSTRARQKPGRGTSVPVRQADGVGNRKSPPTRSPTKAQMRYGARARAGAALFGAALLLSILAYAEVQGEGALIELEALGPGVAAD